MTTESLRKSIAESLAFNDYLSYATHFIPVAVVDPMQNIFSTTESSAHFMYFMQKCVLKFSKPTIQTLKEDKYR